MARKKLTHCKRGHEMVDANKLIMKSGHAQCRECSCVRGGLRYFGLGSGLPPNGWLDRVHPSTQELMHRMLAMGASPSAVADVLGYGKSRLYTYKNRNGISCPVSDDFDMGEYSEEIKGAKFHRKFEQGRAEAKLLFVEAALAEARAAPKKRIMRDRVALAAASAKE